MGDVAGFRAEVIKALKVESRVVEQAGSRINVGENFKVEFLVRNAGLEGVPDDQVSFRNIRLHLRIPSAADKPQAIIVTPAGEVDELALPVPTPYGDTLPGGKRSDGIVVTFKALAAYEIPNRPDMDGEITQMLGTETVTQIRLRADVDAGLLLAGLEATAEPLTLDIKPA